MVGRFLQRLLDAKEPEFTTGIRELEISTAHGGVDTRLIADITHTAHAVMRQLGLDPKDTTSRELYLALLASIRAGKGEDLYLDTDYTLIVIDGMVISFNLIDLIESAHHELPLDQRILTHARRSLRGEIVQRYLQHSRTDEQATRHIAATSGLIKDEDSWYSALYKPSRQKQEENNLKPYILAVGDIFTDVFIKLLDDEARIDIDKDGSKRLSIPFGSKPPYERADVVTSVGPSPNAAVSCARLGLRVGLMSWLGDDQTSKDSLRYLKDEKIDIDPMVIKEGKLSNTYYVLRYGADRTILVKNEKYDYSWNDPKTKPDWIYLSLVSEDSWQLHEDIMDYLDANQDISLAFQPGTFHFKWGKDKLAKIYGRSRIVVMNREEAVDVTGESYDDLKKLAEALHELGPEYVVITDGPDGSYASYDGKLIKMPNYPDPAPPLDRTGAGDAFASTIVAALALGENIETALKWAPINSMSVVQKLGAQAGLLNRTRIDDYLQSAPDEYQKEDM